MRLLRTLTLWVVCLMAGAGCVYDPTEVFVVLATDAPAEQVMLITATVRSGMATTGDGESHSWRRGGAGSSGTFDAGRFDAGPGGGAAIMLPASFAVTPGENRPRDGVVTLVIDAQLLGRTDREAPTVFRRITRFTFTPRTRTMVQVFLSVACGASAMGCRAAPCTVSQRCEEMDMTCGDRGLCVSRDMPTEMLDPEAGVPNDIRRETSAADIPCSMSCPAGANGMGVCLRGVCGFACSGGFGNCNAMSVDGCETNTNTNPDHCGACGHVCPADQACSLGSCVVMCPAGETNCSRSCVDLRTEEAHCGMCGRVCLATANTTPTCLMGTCTNPCVAGFSDCDRAATNGCEVNTQASLANCGACGTLCMMRPNSTPACRTGVCGLNCRAGTGNCNGDDGDGCETDVQTSLLNCGTCGTACPNRANATTTCNGACGFTCNAGFADCDRIAANGCEANLATDAANCMACGTVCASRPASTPRCAMGTCGVRCNLGFGDCNTSLLDGCETDTRMNLANCGMCGNACPPRPNSTPQCLASACLNVCSPNFEDCNMSAVDGCEVNTQIDTAHCGGCAQPCNLPNAIPACTAGACNIQSCTPGYFNVNGSIGDGCECQDTGGGSTCAGATSLGSVALGGTAMSAIGRLPPAGDSDWFQIDFPLDANFRQHGTGNPRISFSTNDGGEFQFTVFGVGCAASTCAASLTSWSFNDTCVNSNTDCSSRDNPWPTTVFVRVTRTGTAPSCNTYRLAVAR